MHFQNRNSGFPVPIQLVDTERIHVRIFPGVYRAFAAVSIDLSWNAARKRVINRLLNKIAMVDLLGKIATGFCRSLRRVLWGQ